MRPFQQVIGAEFNAAQREFMRRAATAFNKPHCEQLFRDLWDITRKFAVNVNLCEKASGTEKLRLKSSDVWYEGFSCKTASGLACGTREESGANIDERSGCSGTTFSGTLNILQADEPACFAFGNVTGLDCGGQLDIILGKLCHIGCGYKLL